MAAIFGQDEVVIHLVKVHNCPVDCINYDGYTPLLGAVSEGHASTVKVLISELGADKNASNIDGQSSLHIACLKGHLNVVRILIDEFDLKPENRGFLNRTALHNACQGGYSDILQELIDRYHCNLMDIDEYGLTPLHIATIYGKDSVVKELVVKYDSIVDSTCTDGSTPTHMATLFGHKTTIEILTDVFGAFPCITNKKGKTPVDYDPIDSLLKPQILQCVSYLHQHSVQEKVRNIPMKVLIIGDEERHIMNIVTSSSVYLLPKSNADTVTGFLTYVDDDLHDVWLYFSPQQHNHCSKTYFRSLLNPSFAVICIVDLDVGTQQAISYIESQLTVLNIRCSEAISLVICGISTRAKYACQKQMKEVYDHVQTIDRRSHRIKLIDSFCVTKLNNEEDYSVLFTSLLKKLRVSSNTQSTQLTYGSIYLLKLLLRDFSSRLYLSFSELHTYLLGKKIFYEDAITIKRISLLLEDLDSLGFIVIVKDKTNLESMIIIINHLRAFEILSKECKKSDDALIKKGLISKAFMSSLPLNSKPNTNNVAVTLSVLKTYGLPVIKYPSQILPSKQESYVYDHLFFMPHLVTIARGVREWHYSCDDPFTIGFTLEVTEGSDSFMFEFQYSVQTLIAEYFLNTDVNLQRDVHNEIWQGGMSWGMDGIEIVAEFLDGGNSLALLGRSSSDLQYKCINMMSKVQEVLLESLYHHSTNVTYKVYVLNPDDIKTNTIPLATNIPKVEATTALNIIATDYDYINLSNGKTLEVQRLKWLQRFTLKGEHYYHCFKTFRVSHVFISHAKNNHSIIIKGYTV